MNQITQRVKSWLKSWFQGLEAGTQQRLLWIAVAGVVALFLLLLGSSLPVSRTPQPAVLKTDYKGASTAVSPQETWSEKMSTQVEEVKKQLKAASTSHSVLKGQIEALVTAVQALGKSQELTPQQETKDAALPLQNSFAPSASSSSVLPKSNGMTPFETPGAEGLSPQEGSKFGVLSRDSSELGKAEKPDTTLRIVENTVPAGSHVQAVLTSAVAASTATNSPNDPQPVTLRLMGEGNLPRGWKSSLKDAVLVGACYGDLSSERVLCRLTTLSWVEPNGEVSERDVEGWIVGEDGRYGIRGIVVDRAGIAARESFISGVLSGIAGFFQAQTTSSVFPVSPFGQSAALKGREMLTAGAANGVGKALDRLSEFYIKRAESMSPVLLVNAGRVVDIVFKKGLDLRGSFLRQRVSSAAEKFRKQLALRNSSERRTSDVGF